MFSKRKKIIRSRLLTFFRQRYVQSQHYHFHPSGNASVQRCSDLLKDRHLSAVEFDDVQKILLQYGQGHRSQSRLVHLVPNVRWISMASLYLYAMHCLTKLQLEFEPFKHKNEILIIKLRAEMELVDEIENKFENLHDRHPKCGHICPLAKNHGPSKMKV